MTRLAMISAVNPYPSDAGKKVVIAGVLDYFVTRLGAENVRYLFIGSEPPAAFPVPLEVLAGPTARQALASTALRTLTGRSSMQEALLWSRSTETEIQRCLRDFGADIEFYDTVRTGQYAGDGPGPTRICYLDDLFSERYRSMLLAGRADRSVQFNPLGNFAAHLPQRLHFLTENRVSQRALLSAERALIARSENRAARSFDRCLLVNERETELLRTRAAVPDGRIATIPPLLRSAIAAQRDYGGGPQFLFLGLLSQPHNDDGLRTFIRDTWPAVLRRMPDARLRVVGREPLPELQAVIAKFGGGTVSLEGYVANLDVVMAESAAMINPLRLGSGIKLKIIESLARGLPVVSTGIGASGLDSGAEYGICVADHVDEWVDQLEGLMSPTHNASVSAAASAHFVRTYSRDAVFASYDRIFGLG